MPDEDVESVATNGDHPASSNGSHPEAAQEVSDWWDKGRGNRFTPTNHPTTRPGAVRGMNASLTAPNVGNGLRERDPAADHSTRRRIAVGAALATIGAVAGVMTFRTVDSAPASYAGEVTMSNVYDLNFPSSGKLTEILVSPGQTVRAGQVLARQDTTALQNQLSAAQGVLRANQQILALDRAPQLTSAQGQQDDLLVQQAQAALTNAQSLLVSVKASGQAAAAAAQAAVSGDQSLLTTDQARYAQACPSGPIMPDPNLNGTLLQIAEERYGRCQDLQSEVDKDSATLNQDQAHVAVVETQSQTQQGEAQASVIMAQAALSVVSFQRTFQTSSANPITISQAEAGVNQAQEQVTQAQQALQGATLVASGAGTVAEVNGAAGEYVGPEGVRAYLGPAALPATQSTGYQLFPSPTVPSGSSATSAASQPLIEIVGGTQQVLAQVPENEITSIREGAEVQVSIPALRATSAGQVTSVVLSPARTNSVVEYDVLVTLDRPLVGLLPGMSARVRR